MDFALGPRAEYIDDRLQAIADDFRLGTIIDHHDLGGVYNLNVYLHTSTGEYALRVYRPWVIPDRIEFLQDLRRRLGAAGLPVPQPLGWRMTEHLGFESNRLIEVESFIRSEPVAFNWENCIETFAMLGRLHGELDGLAKTIRFVPPKVHNYGHPADLLELLQQTKRHVQKQNATLEKKKTFEICGRAEVNLAMLARWWERKGQYLPRQIVHGDYGGENILWRYGKIVALLDFDLVDHHERVFELAYTTYWLFDRVAYGRSPRHWPWHKLPALLMAYQAEASDGFLEMEMNAFPIQMARVPLYWIATAGFELNPMKAILDRVDYVEKSSWLLSNYDSVLKCCFP